MPSVSTLIVTVGLFATVASLAEAAFLKFVYVIEKSVLPDVTNVLAAVPLEPSK